MKARLCQAIALQSWRMSSQRVHQHLRAASAVRSNGGIVAGVLAVVDRNEGGREALEEQGFPVIALTTAADIVDAASDRQVALSTAHVASVSASVLPDVSSATEMGAKFRRLRKVGNDQILTKSLKHSFSIVLLTEFDRSQLNQSSNVSTEALRR